MRFYDLTKLAVLTFFVTLASPSVYGPVAFATQPPMQSQTILQDFSESAKTLPRKLLLQGHAKIGDIELDDLLTVFDSVHLAVTSTVAHRQTMGGEFKMERDSAEWHRAYSDSSIHINGPMWVKTKAKNKPMLALHETLGALGYADDNFSCSSLLWLLANDRTATVLTRSELAQIQKMAENECRFAGGSTGVYGGGDEYDVSSKITLMEKSLVQTHSAANSEVRERAFSDLENTVYEEFEVNRHPKSTGLAAIMDASKKCLDRVPDVKSIRVWVNEAPVARDSRNGWTYDATSNCVQLHGKAIQPIQLGVPSIAVLSTPLN